MAFGIRCRRLIQVLRPQGTSRRSGGAVPLAVATRPAPPRGERILELSLVQALVDLAPLQELGVASLVHDGPRVEHQNAVCADHRREAVCDHRRGAPVHEDAPVIVTALRIG
jgi:hypothetical protein